MFDGIWDERLEGGWDECEVKGDRMTGSQGSHFIIYLHSEQLVNLTAIARSLVIQTYRATREIISITWPFNLKILLSML